MELTKEDILMIGSHVDAAAICGISRMVFTKHHAYAISDDHTSCIVSPCEISIPKDVSIGIGSLVDFNKRFSTYKDNAVVELDVRSDNKTKSITFRTGKSKMSFRCTDHTKIQYPKSANDTDRGIFEISKSEAQEIKKAISVMLKPEYLNITISSKGQVVVKIQDQNNDVFEVFLDAPFTTLEESDTLTYSNKFDCRGPFMTSMQEFIKTGDRIGFIVTDSGNLKAVFDGVVEVFLIPSITSDDE